MKNKIQNLSNNINSLDILRIIATLMVLAVHLGQRILPIDHPIRYFTNLGDRGVPIFFSLSGYLIMISLSKSNSNSTYYIKRLFRIIPLYYAILIINLLFREMPTDELGLGWPRYFLFLNEIIPADHNEWISICGFWCIPSFLIFYLISPLVYKNVTLLIKCYY